MENLLILIALIVSGLSIGLLFDALLLHSAAKIMEVESAKYRTAIKTMLVLTIANVTLLALLTILNLPDDTRYFISIIVSMILLYKLLQKYYNLNFKKTLGLYVVYTAFSFVFMIIVLTVIFAIRSFIVQPFFVKGESMSPFLNNNDYMLINEFDRDYKRGDVIVYKAPKDPSEYLVKRIVGLPGEKVVIKGKEVFVYDGENPEGIKLSEEYLQKQVTIVSPDEMVTQLKNSEYYVMGDYRDKSYDSRIVGPIDQSLIIGKFWLKASELTMGHN